MIADIAVGIFLLAGIFAGIRLVRGPSLADRVISLDAALVALMGAIGTRVAETGDTLYIGVLVVIAIIAIVAFKGKVQDLWNAISEGINSL